MPRKARTVSSTGIYHVMMRGINLQRIFEDDEDYEVLLLKLRQLTHEPSTPRSSTPSIAVYSYALMPNHIHLHLKVLEGKLGKVIQKIAGAYVYHYNLRHGRIGHLFQERYRSEPCETDEYAQTLARYIHQNPLVAGLTNNINDYKYTSWHEYSGLIPEGQKICDTSVILKQVSKDDLYSLIQEPLDEKAPCIDIKPMKRRRLTDDAVAEMLKNMGYENGWEMQSIDINTRNDVITKLVAKGAGIRQLQRVTGLATKTISKIAQRTTW